MKKLYRKLKKRPLRRSGKHRTKRKGIETTLRNLNRNHHKPELVHELQTLAFGILQLNLLGIMIELANTLLLKCSIPKYIPLII